MSRSTWRPWCLAAVSLVMVGGPARSLAEGIPERPGGGSPAVAQESDGAARWLDELPLVFVENRGQWDTPAEFVADRGSVKAQFERNAVSFE